jgi:hypothetical protein
VLLLVVLLRVVPELLVPEEVEVLVELEVEVLVDVPAMGSQVCVTVEHVLTAGLQQPTCGGLHALSGKQPDPERQ